jgi:hypothetical protein
MRRDIVIGLITALFMVAFLLWSSAHVASGLIDEVISIF